MIPLTGLILPLFPACPKPGPGFPTSYVVFFMFNELREVIVRFVNNGEIVDHHSLNFLSVMVKILNG